MRAKKSIIRQQSIHRLMNRIFIPLIVVSFLLPFSKSYGLVPDYADVINFKGNGITIKGKPVHKGQAQMKYKDQLKVPPASGNSVNLDLIKAGSGALSIQVEAMNMQLTTFFFPCSTSLGNTTKVEFAWSDGNQTACREGIHVTHTTGQVSNLPNSQPTQIAQTKNSDKNQLFLQAQTQGSRLFYYCSSVPDSGSSKGTIQLESSSIEEACQKSQKKCESDNSNGCSIATMGEWNVNDSNLMMSVTCADGQSSSQRTTGKSLGYDYFFHLAGRVQNACYFEVYQPDEILISPVSNQETKVITTGLDRGQIQVDVIEGQVKLRSTENPKGIIANQGDSYIFNGAGSMSPSEQRQPTFKPNS